MGDRVNIVVLQDETPPVVIYSHWGGMELIRTIEDWVDDKVSQRVGDHSYYTLELIDKAMENYVVSGISTRLTMEDYNSVLVVDPSNGTHYRVSFDEAESLIVYTS